jgi:hypothetical protein
MESVEQKVGEVIDSSIAVIQPIPDMGTTTNPVLWVPEVE